MTVNKLHNQYTEVVDIAEYSCQHIESQQHSTNNSTAADDVQTAIQFIEIQKQRQ